MKKENNCCLEQYNSCCCNCRNHYEDFYHCTTTPKPFDYDKNNHRCVCGEHKGWICLISLEGEKPYAYSNWAEHGMCEMYVPKRDKFLEKTDLIKEIL